MKHALIIGAGRLGKGFIGETLANAKGWRTTFIDIDDKVIDAMKHQGYYDVCVHRETSIEEHRVQGYDAYTWKQSGAMESVVDADVIYFVIYPEQIPQAICSVCEGLYHRAKEQPDKKLSIIFITNKNHLMNGIEQQFMKHLPAETHAWFQEQVVLRDSIVRRSTDAQSNTALQIRTTAVLSLLIQQPLNVDISDIEWMETCDQLELLKDVKVFVVNGPHAASAFMGYYKGYETINEISSDEEGAAFIQKVEKEITEGVLQHYPLTKEQLYNLSHFPAAKGEMIDYIYRVAYDPIRKLTKGDRLAGSAAMCYAHGLSYDAIAKAMAYGFLYDEPRDAQAIALQEQIQKMGILQTIVKLTGFPKEHEVTKRILYHYEQLKIA